MSDTAPLEPGSPAPAFSVVDQDEAPFSLDSAAGRWLVLYAYPKDNTSGCTVEAQEFTALAADFEAAGARVAGVSPDSAKSHRRFIEKKELGVTLLSDPEHAILEPYGAWQLKRNYGREYMGVVRSTVLIDPEGVVRKVWPKVRAKGHAAQVLDTLRELQAG